jgi:hypothetical protein
MGENNKAVNGSNDDVNRALAAFGALPMPYRVFEETHGRASNPEPTPPADFEFRLLCAALPEVTQIQVPAASLARSIASNQPIPSSPLQSSQTTDMSETSEWMAPIFPETGADTRPTISDETDVTRVHVGLKSGRRAPTQGVVPDALAEQPSPPSSFDVQTSKMMLSAVFRTLRGAGPVQENRSVESSGLQSVFRRL